MLYIYFDGSFILLILHIAKAFEEKQGQNVAFPVGAIHWTAAQHVGGFPQMGFQFGQGNWWQEQGCLLHESLRFLWTMGM